MKATTQRWLFRYAIALASVLGALLLRFLLDPTLGDLAPFLVFIFAATVSSWYGGVGPGLSATVLSVLLGNFFFTDPVYSIAVADGAEAVQVAVFTLEGALISVLSEARLRAERKAQRRAERLRDLASELTLAEERQRRELAKGLHDHLQQLLVACRMRLSSLRNAPAPHGSAAREVDRLVGDAIDFTRTLTADLSPTALYHLGLFAGLEWLAGELQRRFAFRIEVRGDQEVGPASDDLRALLYQAARELLFNAIKYSKADRASVTLERTPDGLRLTVEDHGVGFDPAKLHARRAGPGGFGLFSIRERLDALGGRLEVTSAPGKGARFTLVVPLEAAGDKSLSPAAAPG